MNDLINRQDAIEAIHTWDKFGVDALGRVVWWHEGLEPYVHLRDVVRVIENMPSAQPEITLESAIDYLHNIGWMQEHDRIMAESAQPEIIRCKDCEYGEQDEVGRWFCRSLGCQIGNEDGSGYCADAERREEDV